MENIDIRAENRLRKDLIETFEQVKESVRRTEKKSRAGLMLGLQEMGSTMGGFIGGYYPVDSNIIVLNRTPLRRIEETDPRLLKPYTFHVMLHEYIHSLGLLDEEATRRKTYEVSVACFGEEHMVTQLSRDMTKFFPNLVYPVYGWNPQQPAPVEIMKGFDRSSTQQYIA
jgi:hypothetical protein